MDPESMLNSIRNLARNEVVNVELVSMPFHEDIEFSESVEVLPKELVLLFARLFNDKMEKIQLKALLFFQPKISASPTCHKLLNPRVESYRCFDCQIHSESLLCQDCFKQGNHTRHRYCIVKQQGNCDCGCKDIIKQQGFCSQHRGEQQIVEINSNQEFLFNLYIRQLFIWILKLFRYEHKDEGELLLLHFIKYLAYLNEKSAYYNTLTTRLLFSEIDPIADHLYYLAINASEKLKMVNATISLYYHILGLREFKEKLLVSLLANYNKVDNFQTSRFMKLTNPLFSETQVVISVMKKHPIALRPQRKFSILAYYGLIGMISTLTHADASRALITPLLMVDSIKFPFLQQIQQKCEKDNSLIVEVFPMFIKEEAFYYEHLTYIVKLIDDKSVLGAVMRNYHRMAKGFSFRKNKIILVPQRIIVLAIYKYYDFDLSKISKEELADIMELSYGQLQEFLFNACKKFAECLFEFSMNLNRTTYFENYIPFYAKEEQVICIDLLGVRMFSRVLGSKAMHGISDHIYRQDLVRYSPQERSDFFKAGNIFLKVIMEAITSLRTEMLISAKLGNQDKQSLHFYKSFFEKVGQVTKEELNMISLAFCNEEMISKAIIEQTLSFNASKKKFTSKTGEDKAYGIHLQFIVSLLPTTLSKFVQKKVQLQPQPMHLNEFDQSLKETILSCDTLQRVVKNQLLLINNNPDYKLLIRDLVNTIKTLKVAYHQQLQDYNRIYYVILQIIHLKYVNSSKEEQHQNNQFLQQIYETINTEKTVQKKQQATSKEAQRRKQLLRLKKQKMMKNKKIKENQQLFLSKQPEACQQQKQQQAEMCLICRQSTKSEEMCYLAKMRYTNLLFDFMKIKQNNIVFKSCFHTVHFQCFNQLNKPNEETTCPLCKCAVNIVLPLSNNYSFDLHEKTYKRIDLVLSYFSMNLECEGKKQFICEALFYFVYVLLANIQDLEQITAKQLKLMRIVFGLVEHCMNLENYIERRAGKAYDNLYLFTDSLRKVGTAESKLYVKLMFLVYSRSKWNEYFQEEEESALALIEALTNHLPLSTIHQITKIVFGLGELHDPQRFTAFSQYLENIRQLQPPLAVSFLQFWSPPKTLDLLFQLRDQCSKTCKISHQICICTICHKQYCLSCKKVASHCRESHSRESLFFNTNTARMHYFYHGMQLQLRCFYENQFLKVWKPEYPIQPFCLNFKLYQEVLAELSNGNLFSYLINHFQGLKGGHTADRI